jgi:hypothetical protein
MSPHRITGVALLCLGYWSTAQAEQSSDAVKQRIVAQAQSLTADSYAFTRTVRTEQITGGKTEQEVAVERFDPVKPAEARWTLVSINGAPPSVEALRAFQKNAAKRRVPGYYRLAVYFGSPSIASTDAQGRKVFRFTALPKDAVIVLDTDVSQNATAEATVSEANGVPFVEEVRITLKPMRIKLLVKIDRFESMMCFRIGPEGKPLLTEQTSDTSGSAMGKQGQVRTQIAYTDYRPTAAQR